MPVLFLAQKSQEPDFCRLSELEFSPTIIIAWSVLHSEYMQPSGDTYRCSGLLQLPVKKKLPKVQGTAVSRRVYFSVANCNYL